MDFLTSLVNSMPGAVAQGLIWGIMAIGVYITYRILDVADLTVDGSLGTGGAVCVVLVLNGVPVGVALVAATLAGMLAGLVTGWFAPVARSEQPSSVPKNQYSTPIRTAQKMSSTKIGLLSASART